MSKYWKEGFYLLVTQELGGIRAYNFCFFYSTKFLENFRLCFNDNLELEIQFIS